MRNHFDPAIAASPAEPAKRRWRTPPWLLATIQAEFGSFGLDAAADAENSAAPLYIDRARDTLQTEWSLARGGPVWFNPPYGAKAGQCPENCRKDHNHHPFSFPGTGAFVERALLQSRAHRLQVCMLLESATDAGWWRTAQRAAAETRLLPRIAFCDEQGKPMGNPAGSNTLFVLDGRRPVDAPPGPVWCWDVEE